MAKNKAMAVLLAASLVLGGCAGGQKEAETGAKAAEKGTIQNIEERTEFPEETAADDYTESQDVSEEYLDEPEEDTDEYIGEESDDNFTYSIYEKHAEIKGWLGSGREVTIPDGFNGLPVTVIGDEVFKGQEKITKVNIGQNVTHIGTWSFFSRTTKSVLTEVFFAAPEKIEYIGDNAFEGCELLKEIPYLSSLKHLGDGAFTNTGLTEIIIPSSLLEFGGYCFSNCKKLKSIKIEDGLTTIGEGAFSSCPIETITIPDSVESIGESAFYECKNLKEFTIGSGVRRIEEHSFYDCEVLENVNLSEGLEFIGNGVFSCCKSITEIDIPSSVTELGYGAFSYCTSLKKVTLNKGIEIINRQAFDGCEQLEEINLPDTITEIGEITFHGCYNLKELTIPGSVAIVDRICSYCESFEKLTLNEGVISLKFLNDRLEPSHKLKEVNLPDSLAKIEGFVDCPNVVFTYKGKQYTFDQRDELFALING